jgi:hypothetical protein
MKRGLCGQRRASTGGLHHSDKDYLLETNRAIWLPSGPQKRASAASGCWRQSAASRIDIAKFNFSAYARRELYRRNQPFHGR